MTDTTLSLAARLAANLIVDAINLAKPGARLAGKIGDGALNLIGGPAFSERDAQRFLTMGGSERLAEAEAERDVYEPDPLWSAARVREQEENIGRAVHPLYWEAQYNTMPNWQSPKPSAPVAPKPTDVAGSPGSASASPLPGADSGHLNQPVGVGVVAPGTGGTPAQVTSALLREVADEFTQTVYGRPNGYQRQLITELRNRSTQLAAHGD